MQKVVQISVIVTLCATSILAIRLITLVDSLKVLVPKVDSALSSVQAMELNTTRTEAELSGLLNQTRHMAMDERKAQSQQLADLHSLSVKAGYLLDDTDVSVRKLGNAADSLNDVGPVAEVSIQSATSDIHNAAVSSTHMMDAVTIDLSDPAIQRAIDAAAQASQNTSTATKNLADTTQDIKDYVHRETTPVRGTWNFIKGLINLTWSIRGAFGF